MRGDCRPTPHGSDLRSGESRVRCRGAGLAARCSDPEDASPSTLIGEESRSPRARPSSLAAPWRRLERSQNPELCTVGLALGSEEFCEPAVSGDCACTARRDSPSAVGRWPGTAQSFIRFEKGRALDERTFLIACVNSPGSLGGSKNESRRGWRTSRFVDDDRRTSVSAAEMLPTDSVKCVENDCSIRFPVNRFGQPHQSALLIDLPRSAAGETNGVASAATPSGPTQYLAPICREQRRGSLNRRRHA